MLRLETPHQPLPDNLWHTLLISALTAAFFWLGWLDGLALFRSGDPVALGEQLLRDGGLVHPLYRFLESLTDPLTPWLWNRVLSGTGWVLSLVLVLRVLTRLSGFLSALPSFLLMAALPGLSANMCAGASGSFAVWFYLMGFSALLVEEDSGAWLRGGIYAALASALDPQWLLPSLGLLAGLWEIHRERLPRAALGFGATLAAALLLLLLLAPAWLGAYLPSRGGAPDIAFLLRTHPFLLGAGLLMLVYGWKRRGLLWWALLFSLPASLLHPASLPGVILLLVGIARLPALIGVRHPRIYQTVLLCQLLLWLPSFL